MENMNIFRLLEGLVEEGRPFNIEAYLEDIGDDTDLGAKNKLVFTFRRADLDLYGEDLDLYEYEDGPYNISVYSNTNDDMKCISEFFECKNTEEASWFIRANLDRCTENDMVCTALYIVKKAKAVGYGPIKSED